MLLSSFRHLLLCVQQEDDRHQSPLFLGNLQSSERRQKIKRKWNEQDDFIELASNKRRPCREIAADGGLGLGPRVRPQGNEGPAKVAKTGARRRECGRNKYNGPEPG